MNPFETEFQRQCSDVHSDMYVHMPVLREYASNCDHVTEFGVRGGVSTTAFMHARPRRFVAYDLVRSQEALALFSIAAANDLSYDFVEADVLKVTIEPTDFLFIDTYHCYSQLTAELRRHSESVRRYIGFHDVETFGEWPESPIYWGEPESRGIMPAITEFLGEHQNWQQVHFTKECYGLMIIERRHG